jgi:hypothetical protein
MDIGAAPPLLDAVDAAAATGLLDEGCKMDIGAAPPLLDAVDAVAATGLLDETKVRAAEGVVHSVYVREWEDK